MLQYFVDLAGSEKAHDNSGDRFREGCAINKSLFTLGSVIRKLSGDPKLGHILCINLITLAFIRLFSQFSATYVSVIFVPFN